LEPVTHLLTGFCLARSGLNRKTGLATLTLVLASDAPDIDMLSYFGGSVASLQHHRGFTHTLLGAPFVGVGVLALVYGIYRWQLRRGRSFKHPPNWKLLYGYAVLAVLVHLFMDFTNSYGVRPFAPFNWKWYSWDIFFIFDPILFSILFLALVIPALLGLVSEEIGARKSPGGRGAAIFALSCFLALIYMRDFEHRRAVNLLKSFNYSDEEPLRASAFPTMVNPFDWNGVVETRDFLEPPRVDVRAGQVESKALKYSKPEETQVTLAAKKSRLGRVYLDWAQYPVVEAERLPNDEGHKVIFMDLRFLHTVPDQRRPPLTGYVILDPKLQVVDMYVGERGKSSK
jgi:inner membrane protein